ncbi:MAG: DNA endonuclease SmrA [Kangiellaceae bacterium]|jgi:DNA-nicking Smr family endonuclease|nr:DNA endonuclease SmrA [Kangiellaceae bacterium]
MTKKSIFEQEFADIKPLKQDKIATQTKTVKDVSQETRRLAATTDLAKDLNYLVDSPVDPADPQEILSFKIDGLQSGVFKKLRQGKYPIEASLDLHRHTVAEARSALYQFIQKAIRLECRTLLVTHGKGAQSNPPARIKSYTYHWLQQVPEVMGFHSALNKHGGTGSVYVLLQKSQRERIANKEKFQ